MGLGAPTKTDTVVDKKTIANYLRSSMFYHGSWYGFLKQTLIIGKIELHDSSFTFTPYDEVPGWPQESFEKYYPFNSGFKTVCIMYKDVKSIRYTGRIKLKNGVVHQMFGVRRRYWRPLYLQIKAKVKSQH